MATWWTTSIATSTPYCSTTPRRAKMATASSREPALRSARGKGEGKDAQEGAFVFLSITGRSFLHCIPSSYVSFGSESDGGYMDMSKDEPSVYMAMQEQIDAIKYADIQPSPYESSYQQDIYQEQGLASIRFLR